MVGWWARFSQLDFGDWTSFVFRLRVAVNTGHFNTVSVSFGKKKLVVQHTFRTGMSGYLVPQIVEAFEPATSGDSSCSLPPPIDMETLRPAHHTCLAKNSLFKPDATHLTSPIVRWDE